MKEREGDLNQAYKNGYREGHRKGYDDGYNDGYNDGYDDGVDATTVKPESKLTAQEIWERL